MPHLIFREYFDRYESFRRILEECIGRDNRFQIVDSECYNQGEKRLGRAVKQLESGERSELSDTFLRTCAELGCRDAVKQRNNRLRLFNRHVRELRHRDDSVEVKSDSFAECGNWRGQKRLITETCLNALQAKYVGITHACNNNKTLAASILGIDRGTLSKALRGRMLAINIPPEVTRDGEFYVEKGDLLSYESPDCLLVVPRKQYKEFVWRVYLDAKGTKLLPAESR